MPEGSSQHQTHFYIELGGQSTPPDLQEALQQIQVDSSLHLPDVATLILSDNEAKWADEASLMPGKTLKIKSKTEQGDNTIFDGEIVELEPSFEGAQQKVTVRAFDRLHRLTRGRYVRTFVQMTDSDVMEKIIREVGLKADVTSSSEVYEHIFQPNQSNLEFLQTRAAALGRFLYAEGETIHCAPPSSDPALELRLHEELTAFFPRLSTSAQVAEVQVRGWNVKDKQEVLGKATKGTTAPKNGVAQSGGDLASAAHSVAAKYLVNEPLTRTQSAADKLAQAVADRFEGQKIEASGSASGNPKLLAGSKIKISGVGERFSGEYFVTGATHSFSPNEGYSTTFTVSSHSPQNLVSILSPDREFRAPSTVAVALVTDNKDPLDIGRVKLKYPFLSSDDGSDWARVISVGGGKKRGVMYTPEVGDEVLVGFEHSDLDQPYVLGGLWNGKDDPPLPNDKAIDQRIIESRSGHTFILDDTDGKENITILDKTGKNLIKIDSSTGDLTIEMEGKVTVTAKGAMKFRSEQGIEMEAATDIKMKAQASVNIEGTTGVDVKGMTLSLKGDTTAKLEGGAMTEVKGGIVKIN
jgi:phage protein D/phage baseplate assembly protein gpV